MLLLGEAIAAAGVLIGGVDRSALALGGVDGGLRRDSFIMAAGIPGLIRSGMRRRRWWAKYTDSGIATSRGD